MEAFPLIRTKWSNMRVMTALFFVLVLYRVPEWIQNPAGILGFLALLAFGLALDVAVNFIRYKKPVCAVSAAVTVSVLGALAPGVPLWALLIAVAAALLAGKHLWGGTGKNPVNPAMVGLLSLGLLFPVKFPAFEPSLLLLPAVLLSLPFIAFRPFAAVGMMAGMALSLLLNQGLDLDIVLSSGLLFWGCLVITDPVTTTPKPLVGAGIGLLAGFLPLYFGGSMAAMAAGMISANLLSLLADRLFSSPGIHLRMRFNSRQRMPFVYEGTAYHNLAGKPDGLQGEAVQYTREEILDRIERNKVFGMGGAAFPAIRKIKAVLGAASAEKHLVVNGVECDPGLVHDKWLLRAHGREIIEGIRLLCLCIPFRSVTVAVKDSAGLAFPEGIALRRVPDYYPAGAEKVLIREVLGKMLSHEAVPAAEGILVLNVQTIYSIYDAVCMDCPADTRFITVANTRQMSAQVARVRLGTKISEVAEALHPAAACAFAGGGMMNARLAGDDAAVDETVNFIAVGSFPHYSESPLCSKCGLCSTVCPAGLPIYEVARLVDEGKVESTLKYRPERCMACGSCSHVCLARRNLGARMGAARQRARG